MLFGNLLSAVRSFGIKQATNLVLWSQDFTNAYWTKNRVTLTAGVTAPDGTTTAFKMTEGTTANATFGLARISAVATPGGMGVYSAHVKAGERTACYLQTNNAGANQRAFFDLVTGTVVGTPDLCIAGILPVQGAPGWYRIWIATNSVVDGWVKVYMSNSPGVSTYTGDGVSGMYIWGADVKADNYLSTYIPTAAAPVAAAVSRLISNTFGDPVFTGIGG